MGTPISQSQSGGSKGRGEGERGRGAGPAHTLGGMGSLRINHALIGTVIAQLPTLGKVGFRDEQLAQHASQPGTSPANAFEQRTKAKRCHWQIPISKTQCPINDQRLSRAGQWRIGGQALSHSNHEFWNATAARPHTRNGHSYLERTAVSALNSAMVLLVPPRMRANNDRNDARQ